MNRMLATAVVAASLIFAGSARADAGRVTRSAAVRAKRPLLLTVGTQVGVDGNLDGFAGVSLGVSYNINAHFAMTAEALLVRKSYWRLFDEDFAALGAGGAVGVRALLLPYAVSPYLFGKLQVLIGKGQPDSSLDGAEVRTSGFGGLGLQYSHSSGFTVDLQLGFGASARNDADARSLFTGGLAVGYRF